MTKALACADRVASVFEIGTDAAYVGAQDQKLADKVDKSAPFLDFKHVSLTYQGAGAPTLQDMNFTVNRGDTVGIIGGTGSGKTSLVNLIPGFYPATEGEILLEGRDIKTMSDEELRGRIGVVPQKAVLFKGTIRSNLQWGKPDATEEEMWKALELAQASEVVEGKDGKLDATVAQNGKNFSGGQRQRLTIARALVREPEILILDDTAYDRVPRPDQAFHGNDRIKMKTMGKESVMINRDTIDLRYLEQITDSEQVAALGYCVRYAQKHLIDGKKNLIQIVDELEEVMQNKSLAELCESTSSVSCMAVPRRQEIFACFDRYRALRLV